MGLNVGSRLPSLGGGGSASVIYAEHQDKPYRSESHGPFDSTS